MYGCENQSNHGVTSGVLIYISLHQSPLHKRAVCRVLTFAQRRKRVEELTREARRKELMAANAALANNKSSQSKAANDGYDPFAEDAVAGPSKVGRVALSGPAPFPQAKSRKLTSDIASASLDTQDVYQAE